MTEYENVLELNNEVEASLMSSVLEECDIPHRIHSNHDSAYDGIFQVQFGWGHIEAPKEYKEEIERIYNDLKES